MNREEALQLLRAGKPGIEEWNAYRASGSEIPFLSAADLRGANLVGADLRFASFGLARLDGADLTGADLSGASLRQADLFQAVLEGATITNADLRAVDAARCSFIGANLSGADLAGGDFARSDFKGANLHGTNLMGADFGRVDLTEADLREAHLIGTMLAGASFGGALFGGTVLACGLAGVIGLDESEHQMPSPVSISSILSLQAGLPRSFLRGCGLRKEEIEHFESTLTDRVHYDACFLSYHEDDERFATQLHQDLQVSGVRCWKRPHGKTDGSPRTCCDIERTNCGISRLIMLGSQASLTCQVITRELTWVLTQEDLNRSSHNAKTPPILIPVAIDDFAHKQWTSGADHAIQNEHPVIDATLWTDGEDCYKRVLSELKSALNNDKTN